MMGRTLNLPKFLIISLLCTAVAACSKPAEQQATAEQFSRPALIYTVQQSGLSEASFTGVIRSAQRVELAFRQAGKLTQLHAQEGQQVQAGQVLAELDNQELATLLDSARVEYKQAQANYLRAEAIYRDTQAVSRSDLEQLLTKRDVAANKVTQAEQNLDNSLLKAPFAGVIAQKLVNNFHTVQVNQAVYVLHNPTDLEVVIEVPAKYFVQPKASLHGLAEIDTLPGQRFAVTYRYHASDADPLAQTYQVVLGLDDLGAVKLMPGMNARVFAKSASSAEQQNILVPVTAVVPANTGEQFLWLVGSQDKVQKRTVRVGRLFGDQIEVTDGLMAGDRIVVAGVQALTEGMQVHAMTTVETP
ncbi:efflux RND transporter periplasmic adaptor subunit [Rheinheimera sediminis]|uniref:efflux RND transporter periplasmic adaptor subunit n=1 Tax=Rheinheimera sp. YQF-1 TaxID=2499626 RepID=UPI000FDC2A80|nr:efflux RND transporter periplasmic adaptor subunit [Rheinheimera sp. YQF-1]RVT40642.1 efflux RND transporter periplasmic adaptor subunit [Rheinheimera sp. YQF-1]